MPAWTTNDTWGRHFWDWEDPVQTLYPTDFVPMYLMDHQKQFPNWRNDVRNILSLNLVHTSVSPKSNGDTFSGAWAYPESAGCCDRSLSYSPQELARAFARYGVEADSEWGREIARRSELLTTYDGLENGQAIDGIDGTSIVDGSWFKIAQPMALDYVLKTMGWLPEVMGANRENHIMRSSGVVKRVTYGAGEIHYSTFDAPANSSEVLRLAFLPKTITADGKALEQQIKPRGKWLHDSALERGRCHCSNPARWGQGYHHPGNRSSGYGRSLQGWTSRGIGTASDWSMILRRRHRCRRSLGQA